MSDVSALSFFVNACKRKDVVAIPWESSYKSDHPMLGYSVPTLNHGKLYRMKDQVEKHDVLFFSTAFGNFYVVPRGTRVRYGTQQVLVHIPETLYKTPYYLARKLLLPNGELLNHASELEAIIGKEDGKNMLSNKIVSLVELMESVNA